MRVLLVEPQKVPREIEIPEGLKALQEADCMRSRLKITKSRRRYNNPNRMMPGAVFLYEGVRYVMRGQHCNGAYLQAVGMGSRDFPARKCKILTRNTGLVFVS